MKAAAVTPEPRAVLVLDDVYRVDKGEQTLGYIVKCGTVYVSLRGAIYNTSIEVAQSLDLDTALRRLQQALRG